MQVIIVDFYNWKKYLKIELNNLIKMFLKIFNRVLQYFFY